MNRGSYALLNLFPTVHRDYHASCDLVARIAGASGALPIGYRWLICDRGHGKTCCAEAATRLTYPVLAATLHTVPGALGIRPTRRCQARTPDLAALPG